MGKCYFQFERHVQEPEADLFCFHYAGGSPFLYVRWGKYIAENAGFYPYQIAGHGGRTGEDFVPSIEAAAEEAAEVIKDYADSPVVITGHSMGGLIAYQTAFFLEERYGVTARKLFITASSPYLGQIVRRLHDKDIQELGDEEFCNLLIKFGAIDERTLKIPEFRRNFLPILRADFSIVEMYRPDPENRISSDIEVCFGADDTIVNKEGCTHWKEFTSGRVDITEYTGGHFFVNDHIQKICSDINSCINNQEV